MLRVETCNIQAVLIVPLSSSHIFFSVCMAAQSGFLRQADEQSLQPAGAAAAVSIYQSRAP